MEVANIAQFLLHLMPTELSDLPTRRHVPEMDRREEAPRSQQLAIGGESYRTCSVFPDQPQGSQTGDGAGRQWVAVTIESCPRSFLPRGHQPRDEEQPGETGLAALELRPATAATGNGCGSGYRAHGRFEGG